MVNTTTKKGRGVEVPVEGSSERRPNRKPRSTGDLNRWRGVLTEQLRGLSQQGAGHNLIRSSV